MRARVCTCAKFFREIEKQEGILSAYVGAGKIGGTFWPGSQEETCIVYFKIFFIFPGKKEKKSQLPLLLALSPSRGLLPVSLAECFSSPERNSMRG